MLGWRTGVVLIHPAIAETDFFKAGHFEALVMAEVRDDR